MDSEKKEVEERVDLDAEISPAQKNVLAIGGHYLISALFGAVYGLLHWARRFSPIPSGPLYGLTTYVVNLARIGPSLDLTPAPQEEKPLTVGRRVMMHAVYGTVTAFVSKKVRERMVA